MRFALAALFALATSVSASVNAATRDLEACACTPDRLNATGINIGQDEDTYSCSYATGACLRTRVRSRKRPLTSETR